jgi:cyclohexanone monooxygenase
VTAEQTDERPAAAAGPPRRLDVVVVGAGFAGLYALHRLRGLGLSVQVLEAGSGVGGTWFWNRYPGARCDVESIEYSYSFSAELEQEWEWSERYPSQPEILRYIDHVADRFDLRRDIQLDTRVTDAVYDEVGGRWTVTTDRGDEVSAQFCILATGCLSAAKRPEAPGLESFEGDWYHTGQWPHEGVDLRGRRVGVIGTGSSGIQSIPIIAEQAAHLVVFQRTPNFSLPARNKPLDPEAQAAMKASYPALRERARRSYAGIAVPAPSESALAVDPDERRRRYEAAWAAGGLMSMTTTFADLIIDKAANDTAADFIRSKIREVVADPDLAEALTPTDHPFGTKRPCLDSGYFETFNRHNVTLVDLRRTPIVEIVPPGVRTTEAVHELDTLVFATGFDAMTGAVLRIDIRGRAGSPLKEKWAAGPRTYLGLATAGFPNLFMVTGPGSPSVLSNMVVSIEQHVDWIAGCLSFLRAHGIGAIEATLEAEDAWVEHVNELANGTLFPTANSWYVGANVPGKPRVFMPYVGGLPVYRATCDEVAADGYRGFRLTGAGVADAVRLTPGAAAEAGALWITMYHHAALNVPATSSSGTHSARTF